MRIKDPNKNSNRAENLHAAISILEDLDKHRSLHRGVIIFVFIASAGFSFSTINLFVELLFAINEVTIKAEISEKIASLIVFMSWIMVVPIWTLTFLLIMYVFEALGIMDLRSAARGLLSKLDLDVLRDLDDALASRTWNHGLVLKGAITDLINRQLGRR